MCKIFRDLAHVTRELQEFKTTNNMQMSIVIAQMVLISQSVAVQILKRQHVREVFLSFIAILQQDLGISARNFDTIYIQRKWGTRCILFV